MAEVQEARLQRRPLQVLWLAAAALIVLAWWIVFSMEAESRSRQLAAAERDLANLTRVSQEHANRTFRSADQVIRFVQARYLELGQKLDLAALTSQGVIDAEIFNQVGVIDENGIYILSNLPIKGRLDLSDREHFRVHVPADTGQLFVSKPLLGRASGKWSIQLSRRVTRPDGRFAGVVVVSIDPGYFTRFYSELNLGSEGVTALYGLDGVARARKIGKKEEFGTNASASPVFEQMRQGKLEGSYIQRSVVDGVDRMYYFRRVPQYSLAVLAGLDMQDLLANQRRARDAMWLQAASVTLLILALAGALTRYLVRIRKEMTERRLAQLQVLERTEQLNSIFELSPDGFVSFDQQLRVKFVNSAFWQMLSCIGEPLEGMHSDAFIDWLGRRCEPRSRIPSMASLRGNQKPGETESRHLIELSISPRRVLQVGLRVSRSSTVSQILYFRDVTHETEVDQMKSEFLSTAAHELRTPMASIFGFTEVLLTQPCDAAEQREYLDIIYEQSKLMSNILNELLDLARIEARRGKDFEYAKVCLQDLLSDIIKSFALAPGRSAADLTVPDDPVWVMADPRKLRQAIMNVLSNAYKYSPEGLPVQVLLDVESGVDGESQVGIHVIDRGIGMTPDQVARVFERFYRADTSGKIPGTGLGMSIVKEIIDLHRGRIEVRSQPGAGTHVHLKLPLLRAA